MQFHRKTTDKPYSLLEKGMPMLRLLTAFLLAASFASASEPVTLAEFARKHRLVMTRDALTGRDILKGGSTVVLAAGMHCVLVDGAVVPLKQPVRVENGRTVLSSEDADQLTRVVRHGPEAIPAAIVPPAPPPALPPKKPIAKLAPGPGRFRKIVLDPGHGGVHTGGKGAKGTMEKDIALEVSRMIRERLEAEGIQVVMTRETDRHLAPVVRVDLERRVQVTNEVSPDLFLSIHVNWAENKSAEGFEVFYPRAGCAAGQAERSAGRRLAEEVRKTFAGRFDTPDRGVKEAGFYVIKNARCPAVLVELEFVSNARGEAKLRETTYRKKLADAVADAVLAQHRK